METGAFRRIEAALDIGGLHAVAAISGTEKLKMFRQAESVVGGIGSANLRNLMRAARQAEDAALSKIDGDGFFRTDTTDFVYRIEHREQKMTRGLSTEAFLEYRRRHGEPGRAPAAVATRSANAYDSYSTNASPPVGHCATH